jgi:hypothetical protein
VTVDNDPPRVIQEGQFSRDRRSVLSLVRQPMHVRQVAPPNTVSAEDSGSNGNVAGNVAPVPGTWWNVAESFELEDVFHSDDDQAY